MFKIKVLVGPGFGGHLTAESRGREGQVPPSLLMWTLIPSVGSTCTTSSPPRAPPYQDHHLGVRVHQMHVGDTDVQTIALTKCVCALWFPRGAYSRVLGGEEPRGHSKDVD